MDIEILTMIVMIQIIMGMGAILIIIIMMTLIQGLIIIPRAISRGRTAIASTYAYIVAI